MLNTEVIRAATRTRQTQTTIINAQSSEPGCGAVSVVGFNAAIN